jgi:hypothetical protein
MPKNFSPAPFEALSPQKKTTNNYYSSTNSSSVLKKILKSS